MFIANAKLLMKRSSTVRKPHCLLLSSVLLWKIDSTHITVHDDIGGFCTYVAKCIVHIFVIVIFTHPSKA